jgi:hypothetical protein
MKVNGITKGNIESVVAEFNASKGAVTIFVDEPNQALYVGPANFPWTSPSAKITDHELVQKYEWYEPHAQATTVEAVEKLLEARKWWD